MLGNLFRTLFGQPSVRVGPTWLDTSGGRMLGVAVTNTGSAEVEVEEVGFMLTNGQKFCFINGLKGGGMLPRTLQSREIIAVALNPQAQDAAPLASARCAYAVLAGGKRVEGASLAAGELTRQFG